MRSIDDGFSILTIFIGVMTLIIIIFVTLTHNNTNVEIREVKNVVETNQKLTKDLLIKIDKMTEELEKLKK